jgi:hypothetical protein
MEYCGKKLTIENPVAVCVDGEWKRVSHNTPIKAVLPVEEPKLLTVSVIEGGHIWDEVTLSEAQLMTSARELIDAIRYASNEQKWYLVITNYN